jgi:hypothetical protein
MLSMARNEKVIGDRIEVTIDLSGSMPESKAPNKASRQGP